MARTGSRLTSYAPIALSVLRIVAALLFAEHGTQKLFDFPIPAQGGTPDVGTLMWFAGVLEIGGGLLLLIGLFTRPVAFLLSGMMAIAYWSSHFTAAAPWPAGNGGDAAILFCFVFLYLVFAGPGSIAVDAWFNRRRPLRV